MKKMLFENGEIHFGYEYDELPSEIQRKVVYEYITFEIQIMDENSPYFHCAEEMERMQTPWFLHECIYDKHASDIIETIKINEYLFSEKGELLPIVCDTTNKHYYSNKRITFI